MAGPRGLRPSGRATIHDVAAAAGVSRQSVTRAMNDLPGIGAETKQRVLAAAARLNYRPSRFGRGLVSGGPRTLGLVVHDLTNPYYPELASAIIGLGAERGWNVLLADLAHAGPVRTQLDELARQVDAMVGYLDRVDVENLAALGSLPVVDIGDSRAEAVPLAPGHGAVRLEMGPGVEQAVDHLSRLGVRHPVMLDRTSTLDETFRSSSRRAELYRSVWRDRGVELAVVGSATDDVEGGEASMSRALAEHPGLDAVCCYNDRTAFGALATLRRTGVDVPDRVKVVGLDGLSIGALVTPALTTLALDMTEVARQAMDLVFALADPDDDADDDADHADDPGDADDAGQDDATSSRQRFVAHQLLLRDSA